MDYLSRSLQSPAVKRSTSSAPRLFEFAGRKWGGAGGQKQKQHDRQPERTDAPDLADFRPPTSRTTRPAHQAEIALGLAGMASAAMRNVWHASPAICNYARWLNHPAFLDMQEETLEDGIVEATSQPRCQSRECHLAYLCSNPPQSGGHPLHRTHQPSRQENFLPYFLSLSSA